MFLFNLINHIWLAWTTMEDNWASELHDFWATNAVYVVFFIYYISTDSPAAKDYASDSLAS